MAEKGGQEKRGFGPIPKNPYDALGVKPGASKDEIRSAYRRKSGKYHPDKNPGNKEAEEWFKALNEAKDILVNNGRPNAFFRGWDPSSPWTSSASQQRDTTTSRGGDGPSREEQERRRQEKEAREHAQREAQRQHQERQRQAEERRRREDAERAERIRQEQERQSQEAERLRREAERARQEQEQREREAREKTQREAEAERERLALIARLTQEIEKEETELVELEAELTRYRASKKPSESGEKTPETQTFSTTVIEHIIFSLLKNHVMVTKNPHIEGHGKEMTLDTTVTSWGGNIRVLATFENKGNGISVKSFEIQAIWPYKGKAEKKIAPYLGEVSDKVKAFVEQEDTKKRKVAKMEIVNGELKVTFK